MDPQHKITALEAFGEIADIGGDPTIKAGRYPFQKQAERGIFADVLAKLDVQPHHRVLDIGCGSGVLLVPLSYCVTEIVGIDHPKVIAALGRNHRLNNAVLVSGAFPETPVPGVFDRIVAYSVIPCMPDFETVLSFAEAAASMLPPGGRLLLADIPNRDRQLRTRNRPDGAQFEADWVRKRAELLHNKAYSDAQATLQKAVQVGPIGDEEMMRILLHLRKRGFDAWIAPQPESLPFGRTREDIIVVRP